MSLYPHTCTIWCRLDGIGGDSWAHVELSPVRFETSASYHRATGGDTGSRGVLVLVPACALGGYVSPAEFDGTPSTWTARQGDMVSEGGSDEERPPKDAQRITQTNLVRLGKDVHHLEVR